MDAVLSARWRTAGNQAGKDAFQAAGRSLFDEQSARSKGNIAFALENGTKEGRLELVLTQGTILVRLFRTMGVSQGGRADNMPHAHEDQ